MVVNKAHSHDNILVRMTNFNSVAHRLTLIFQNSLAAGTFATQWKRVDIIPIHKKNNKQIVSNYPPASRLSICSKIFEKLVFLSLLKTLICYININQVFVLVIHAFINHLQSLIIPFQALIELNSRNLWGVP